MKIERRVSFLAQLAGLGLIGTLGACGGNDADSCALSADGTTLTCDGRTLQSGCQVVDTDDGQRLVCADGTETDLDDGEDPCALTDNGDGSYQLLCDDGTETTLHPDATRVAEASVAPGESLVLDHGIEGALLSGSFVVDGVARPLGDFPALYSPVVGTPVVEFVSNDDLDDAYVKTLSNGNLLIYKSEGRNYRASFAIVQPDGTEVEGFTALHAGSACYASVAIDPAGGFVMSYQPSCTGALTIKRFDDAGNDVGFGGQNDLILADHFRGACITSLGTTGFAVAYQTTASDEKKVARYDWTGTLIGSPVTFASQEWDADAAILALPNGSVLYVHDEQTTQGFPLTLARVVAADGSMTSHTLAADGLYDPPSLAQNSEGDVLVVAGLDNWGSVIHALIDDEGQLVRGPHTIGYSYEPVSAAAYPDGGFAVAYLDDSNGLAHMWNVGENGLLEHSHPVVLNSGFVPNRRISLIPSGEHQMKAIMETGYFDSFMVDFSRNTLHLVETSATSARIVNRSAQTVTLRLAASGTP